jgi:hypothetical protein
MTVGAAYDRRDQLDKLGREDHYERVQRGQTLSGADRVMYWLSRHYLAVLNVVMLFYFGLPILAPVFMNAGMKLPATIIYTIYKPSATSLDSALFPVREPFYPLEEAHVAGVNRLVR